MDCAICGIDVCLHGTVHCHFGKGEIKSKCLDCGMVGDTEEPPVYCLPFYEGKVDFTSNVFAAVCPDCHEKHGGIMIEIDGWVIRTEKGYGEPPKFRSLLFYCVTGPHVKTETRVDGDGLKVILPADIYTKFKQLTQATVKRSSGA